MATICLRVLATKSRRRQFVAGVDETVHRQAFSDEKFRLAVSTLATIVAEFGNYSRQCG